MPRLINSSPPRQFGGKIADDIFKRIFFKENDWMSFKISMKFVPEGPIDIKSVLAQVMAWRRQSTSHYLTNTDPVSWRIYAALGGDELINEWLVWRWEDHASDVLTRVRVWLFRRTTPAKV